MVLTPGSTLGAYQILEALGRGGMATVYRAYEPRLDRYVALKVLPSEFLHDPTFAERFEKEAKVLARLEHTNIVPIHAFGIDQGVPWMAMRLIQGGSLAARLREGDLSHQSAVAIVQAVAEALDYAHARGVIHRDVKPQNVLLGESGHVYLADFGIARLAEGTAGMTKAGTILGTPEYMAPEQGRGEPADRRVDVYSLAILAYETLVGHVPFSADTPVAVLMKHASEPIPMPQSSKLPERVVRALFKGLAKRPDDRWPSAGALVQALREGLATDSIQPVSQSADVGPGRPTETAQIPGDARATTPAEAPVRKKPLLKRSAVLLSALALVALAVGGVVLLGRVRQPSMPSPAEPLWRKTGPAADGLGEPISMRLADHDLGDALLLFSDISGLSIILDPDISGTVSADFYTTPWDKAFESILASHALTYMRDDSVIRVRKAGPVEELIKNLPGTAMDVADFGTGSAAAQAIPILQASLDDPSVWPRVTSAYALARLDPKADKAVRVLSEGLSDSDPKVRQFVASRLASLDRAKAFLPALKNATRDQDAAVSKEAAEAVATIEKGEPRFTGHPITFKFRNGNLRDVLTLFAPLTGLGVVLDSDVHGLTTLAFNDVPWDLGLEAILKTHGLGYELDGTVLRLAPLAAFEAKNLDQRALSDLADRQKSLGEAYRPDKIPTYQRACAEGVAHSCLLLSSVYRNGWGVKRDVSAADSAERRAVNILTHSCDQGHAEECYVLANALRHDASGPIPERSRALYSKACKLGEARACEAIGPNPKQ